MQKPLTKSKLIDLLHNKFGDKIYYSRNSPYSNSNYCVCVILYKSAEVTVMLNTKNQTLAVTIDKNARQKNEIVTEFIQTFDNVMQKPHLCKFDDKIEGKKRAISVVQWCDNKAIAESLLKTFISRAKQFEDGINNLEYNKKYGETKFSTLFDNYKNSISPELSN